MESVDRRTLLQGYIVKTRRTQKWLTTGLVSATAVAIGLLFWSHTAGGFSLLSVGLIAICGYWITGSHLADWRRQLAELDRPRPQPQAGRRYQR